MFRLSYLIAALIAFAVTAVSGFLIIPWLRKLKFGQTIYELAPKQHQSKQGTPTMGGFMIILGALAGICAGYSLMAPSLKNETGLMFTNQTLSLCVCAGFALVYGAIGYADDHIKVIKKQNLGLTWKMKIVLQVLRTARFLACERYLGHLSTVIELPIFGAIDLGIAYYVISFFGIIFMVNAVNLTDGIDGLCSSVTFVYCLGFMIISAAYGFYANALFSSCVAGACVGFLVWNFNPAKVFMGDTGSMFLGGCVVAMAYSQNRPEVILLSGLVFTCEAMSVLIQMSYFKLTHGKRLFKMTPIHHSFELSGWSEVKIVIAFTAVEVICTALAVLLY